ncbi:coniferyl aldehyde dehydrogenase [Rhizobium sp. C4]|uniref:coniferyl aldehyde dehydrogenase n=1 Tax=Rhizobium sp. C4 TaxID=1349800 RepID=UPI001E3E9959|nr:coniferyl aldehyde dehydrogenase [Rhizobium sp. C4]MCD2172346.1 coniferyl aldehyde dehydrogenase [Rhizobium sp. C4]
MDNVLDDSLKAALERQRSAFQAEPFPSAAIRRDRIDRLRRLVKEQADAFCDAVAADFGNRSRHETTLLEIAPLLAELRHARSHLARWMRPRRRGSSLEFLQLSNWVQYQPLGVVGIMVPWNYPILLALGPLVDVLAAGNRAMIKPSELLPKTSALLAEVVPNYFSPAEVTVVQGGVEVAQAFSGLPFDHLIFTGSTAVGKRVMAAAAQHLTPLTLELGGKSPCVIAPDYPIDAAARDIAFGKMMNAGQTCIAPDYVLVPREKVQQLTEALTARIRSLYPAGAQAGDYSSIIAERFQVRLENAVEEARSRGAKIVTCEIDLSGGGFRFPPTLVIDPPDDCLLMQDEIFGPVLPIVPYDDIAQAVDLINRKDRPLALYLFTHDNTLEKRLLAGTISGNVTINGTLLHIVQTDLPFGGVGPSGQGAYHGFDGFVRFSHARGIAKVRLFNPTIFATPPFGTMAKWLARFMTR